jgi:hypothetical protein
VRGSPFSKRDQLRHLRRAVDQAREELIAAEADLADQKAEIAAFEALVDSRLGGLRSELSSLEEEIQHFRLQIDLIRGGQAFAMGHLPVDEQYRRTWRVDPEDLVAPPRHDVSRHVDVDIKSLYRRLARRFHPDLTADPAEREERTAHMAALNEAYSARDMARMQALAEGRIIQAEGRAPTRPAEPENIDELQRELAQIQVRRSRIQQELDNLFRRPSVQLALDVRLAQRSGRDLLQEMQDDLARQVARRHAERDSLRARFVELGGS